MEAVKECIRKLHIRVRGQFSRCGEHCQYFIPFFLTCVHSPDSLHIFLYRTPIRTIMRTIVRTNS